MNFYLRLMRIEKSKGNLALTCLAVALAILPGVVWAAERVALVIGNSDYQFVEDLANPRNDATDIAASLGAIGFDVTLVKDASAKDLGFALASFKALANNSDIAVIYYAGHAIEIDKKNYIIPTDAQLAAVQDVLTQTVSLEAVVSTTQGASKLGVTIMDACRNNPFLPVLQQSIATRSIALGVDPGEPLRPGLASIEPLGNTLVAYAAREGTVAFDGVGRNSPYAKALIETLQEPGNEVIMVFRKVRDRVLNMTGNMQEPIVFGSISSELIYLNVPPPTKQELREIQERLTVLHYSVGQIDGIPGRKTEAAIEDYQKNASLFVDGLVSRSLLENLRMDVTDDELKQFRAARRLAAARRSQSAAPPPVAEAQPVAPQPAPTRVRKKRRDRNASTGTSSSGGSSW